MDSLEEAPDLTRHGLKLFQHVVALHPLEVFLDRLFQCRLNEVHRLHTWVLPGQLRVVDTATLITGENLWGPNVLGSAEADRAAWSTDRNGLPLQRLHDERFDSLVEVEEVDRLGRDVDADLTALPGCPDQSSRVVATDWSGPSDDLSSTQANLVSHLWGHLNNLALEVDLTRTHSHCHESSLSRALNSETTSACTW